MASGSEHETIRALSDELVELQRPIRILNSVSWSDEIEADFFARGAKEQPKVDASYYQQHRTLGYDPGELRNALRVLSERVRDQLGSAPIADLMCRRLADYRGVIKMLEVRGTPSFTQHSAELYGGVGDELHEGGPTLASLGELMRDALTASTRASGNPPRTESTRQRQQCRFCKTAWHRFAGQTK